MLSHSPKHVVALADINKQTVHADIVNPWMLVFFYEMRLLMQSVIHVGLIIGHKCSSPFCNNVRETRVACCALIIHLNHWESNCLFKNSSLLIATAFLFFTPGVFVSSSLLFIYICMSFGGVSWAWAVDAWTAAVFFSYWELSAPSVLWERVARCGVS